MAPPSPPPALSAVVLTLLAMGVMNGAQAKPVGQNVATLAITSSIRMGHPIFGDTLGPFTAGQQLTLTCSTQASDSVSLSWWEGDTEQNSSVQEAEGIISSSFTIQTLRAEDNGRRLTCKDKQTNTIKDIELLVSTATSYTLEIIKDGEPIEDGHVVKGTAGEDFLLNCVAQGYNPVAVSWWEDGTELESVATKSTYATSSVLSIKALTVDDSRRSFTCRSLNGQLSKTVSLEVAEATSPTLEIIKDGVPIEDGDFVNGYSGEDFHLNCVVQGYHPVAVSWWEGGTELESVATKSTYATSSVLSIKALAVDDSRRSFTCRSLNGQLSKTVSLVVDEDLAIKGILTIAVPLVLLAALVAMAALICKMCTNNKTARGRMAAGSEGSKATSVVIPDNRLTNGLKSNQYNKLIASSAESVCEHGEGSNAL